MADIRDILWQGHAMNNDDVTQSTPEELAVVEQFSQLASFSSEVFRRSAYSVDDVDAEYFMQSESDFTDNYPDCSDLPLPPPPWQFMTHSNETQQHQYDDDIEDTIGEIQEQIENQYGDSGSLCAEQSEMQIRAKTTTTRAAAAAAGTDTSSHHVTTGETAYSQELIHDLPSHAYTSTTGQTVTPLTPDVRHEEQQQQQQEQSATQVDIAANQCNHERVNNAHSSIANSDSNVTAATTKSNTLNSITTPTTATAAAAAAFSSNATGARANAKARDTTTAQQATQASTLSTQSTECDNASCSGGGDDGDDVDTSQHAARNRQALVPADNHQQQAEFYDLLHESTAVINQLQEGDTCVEVVVSERTDNAHYQRLHVQEIFDDPKHAEWNSDDEASLDEHLCGQHDLQSQSDEYRTEYKQQQTSSINEVDRIFEEYLRRKEVRLEEEKRLSQHPNSANYGKLHSDHAHATSDDDDDNDVIAIDVDEISSDVESPPLLAPVHAPGLFPMARYGKMTDLSDAGNVAQQDVSDASNISQPALSDAGNVPQPDNIKDILDQTLETIAEESDEEYLARTSLTSFATADDAHDVITSSSQQPFQQKSHSDVSDGQQTLLSVNASEHLAQSTPFAKSQDKFDWDGQMNCDLVESEFDSDNDGVFENDRTATASSDSMTYNHLKDKNTVNTSNADSNLKATSEPDLNWYEHSGSDIEDMPCAPVRIQWGKVAEGLYRPQLVDPGLASDGSTSTLCADDDELVMSSINNETADDSSRALTNEDSCSRDDVTPHTQSVASGLSPRDHDDLERLQQELWEGDDTDASQANADLNNHQTDPHTDSKERRPFYTEQTVTSETDWNSVDLCCELTESVILSDYVSDSASMASYGDDDDNDGMRECHDVRDARGDSSAQTSATTSRVGEASSSTLEEHLCELQQNNDDLVQYKQLQSDVMHKTPYRGIIDADMNTGLHADIDARLHADMDTRLDAELFQSVTVDTCDRDPGYFSRSQDRDSEIDSMSSPKSSTDRTSPRVDSPPADEPLEGEPEVAQPEVTSRHSRIEQLIRRNSYTQEEFNSAMQSQSLVASSKESLPKLPENERASTNGSSTAAGTDHVTPGEHESNVPANLPDTTRASVNTTKLHDDKTRAGDAHNAAGGGPENDAPSGNSSPSSTSSMHEPHGDEESMNSAWYERPKKNSTPPVKSVMFAPFSHNQVIAPNAMEATSADDVNDDRDDYANKQPSVAASSSQSARQQAPVTESKLLQTLARLHRNDSDRQLSDVTGATQSVMPEQCRDDAKNNNNRPAPNHYAQNVMAELLLKQPLVGGSSSSLTSHGSTSAQQAGDDVNRPSASYPLADGAKSHDYTVTIDRPRKYQFKVRSSELLSSDTDPSGVHSVDQSRESEVIDSAGRAQQHGPVCMRGPLRNSSENIDTSDKAHIGPSRPHSQSGITSRIQALEKSIPNVASSANDDTIEQRYHEIQRNSVQTNDIIANQMIPSRGKQTSKHWPIDPNEATSVKTGVNVPNRECHMGGLDLHPRRTAANGAPQDSAPPQDRLNLNNFSTDKMSSANRTCTLGERNTQDNIDTKASRSSSELYTQTEKKDTNSFVAPFSETNNRLMAHRLAANQRTDYNTRNANQRAYQSQAGHQLQSTVTSQLHVRGDDNADVGQKAFVDRNSQENVYPVQSHVDSAASRAQSQPALPPLPKKRLTDKDSVGATNDITHNIITHGSLQDRSFDENTYENVVAPYRPRQVTAQATSTALARKDFRLSNSQDAKVLADSVVSAVASAEATGENPYIAVARATARAASLATASAAQTASHENRSHGDEVGDNRDITIMINTSCTIQDGSDTDNSQSAHGVVQALNNDANVAVYTRLAPGPKALLSKPEYHRHHSNNNNSKKIKISIEQNDAGDGQYQQGTGIPHQHTIEVSVLDGLDTQQLSAMVTEAVARVIKPNQNSSNANPAPRQQLGGLKQSEYDACAMQSESNEKVAVHQRGSDKTVHQSNTSQSIPSSSDVVLARNQLADTRRPHATAEKRSKSTTGHNSTGISNIDRPIDVKARANKDMVNALPRYSTPNNAQLNRTHTNQKHVSPVTTAATVAENSAQKVSKETWFTQQTLATSSGSRVPEVPDRSTPALVNHNADMTQRVATQRQVQRSQASHMSAQTRQFAQSSDADDRGKHVTQSGADVMRKSHNNTDIGQYGVDHACGRVIPVSAADQQDYARSAANQRDYARSAADQRDYARSQQTTAAPRQLEHEPNDKDMSSSARHGSEQSQNTPQIHFDSSKRPIETATGNRISAPVNHNAVKTMNDRRGEQVQPDVTQTGTAEDYVRLSAVRQRAINMAAQHQKKELNQPHSSKQLDQQLKAPDSMHITEQWNAAMHAAAAADTHDVTDSDARAASRALDNAQRRLYERKQHHGSLPRTVFTPQNGSRTIVTDTDLDTSVGKEEHLVQETHADSQNIKNRARSYGNLNRGDALKSCDAFEKTQSMTHLPAEKASEQNTNVRTVLNGDDQTATTSANEKRLNDSIQKLHVPDWYNQSTAASAKPHSHLTNTHRADITSHQPNYRVLPPTTAASAQDGVAARIVTTKPVVIQHRVVTPVKRKSPQPEQTQPFTLPSERWRQQNKDGVASFKPIPVKAVHDVTVARTDVPATTRTAKEAYLSLMADQSEKQNSGLAGTHNYVNVPTAATLNGSVSDNSVETPPPPLPPRRPPRHPANMTPSPTSSTSQNSASMSPKPMLNSTSGLARQQVREQVLPMSNQQPHHIGHQHSDQSGLRPNGYQQNNGFIQNNDNDYRDKHVESDRQTSGMHSKRPTANQNGGRQAHATFTDTHRVTHQRTLDSRINNNMLPESDSHTKVNGPEEARIDFTSSSHNAVQPQLDNMKRQAARQSHAPAAATTSKPQRLIRDEPVFSRAVHSQNRIVADFAEDLESLDIITYDESPTRRRRLPGESHITRPKSCDQDDVFQNGVITAPRGAQQPMETSFSESRGDVTLDEILDNLSTVPQSMDTSMTSPNRSRVGSRRHASSTSSMQSVEPAHERLFRLLRDTVNGNADKTLDSSISKNSSTGDSPRVTSPRDTLSPPVCDPKSGSMFDTSLDPVDIDDNAVTVKCRNTKCKRQMNLADARHTFKTCHNCFTYYCSRECRQEHWQRHKRKCVFSRVGSNCKHVIKKVHDDSDICEEFSKVARTGFIQKGRGCVVVTFTSLTASDEFLADGYSALDFPLAFVSIKELEESQLFTEQLYELLDMCRTYNPEVKFVINCVIISEEQSMRSGGPMPRRDGAAVKKCAKLRLTNAQLSPKPGLPPLEDNDTLILTAVPGSEFTENMEEKKAREICFANIQRKLRQRGVRLRHQYPEVYNKLCAYVANQEHFAPITLFPADGNTGKRFMCLIMPNSEPEIEWMNKPDLLEELGLNTEL